MNSTRLIGYCVAAALIATTAPIAAQGFELDGNVRQDGFAPPDDWELLYDGGLETGGNASAYTGVIADPGTTTIFAGGRKDIQDITEWQWKGGGGIPDKDDITNAYAAAYVDASNDLIIYFGADRFSNVGDAFMGFWFFKDDVSLNGNGRFNGRHQIGDILVLVNYPQGAGSGPEVSVLEWNPAQQDVATNLHLLFSGPGATCGSVPPMQACAITNSGQIDSPWPYNPKAGTPGFFPFESFFEGGINISQIIGAQTCFATFMAESRASTSITATLKDFVIGDFPVCDLSISKTCDVVGITPAGKFIVEFGGDVTNTGAGTFPVGAEVTVVDNAGTPGDPSDDVVVSQFLTQALAPGASQPYSGSFESDLNPASNSVVATLEFGTTTVSSDPVTVQCNVLVLNPGLNVTKQCELAIETVGGMLVVRVDVTGSVENTGDVPLMVTVDDDKIGRVFGPASINPGEVRDITASYYPTSATGGETDPALASFGDTFTATGEHPALMAPVVEIVAAQCTLCPR